MLSTTYSVLGFFAVILVAKTFGLPMKGAEEKPDLWIDPIDKDSMTDVRQRQADSSMTGYVANKDESYEDDLFIDNENDDDVDVEVDPSNTGKLEEAMLDDAAPVLGSGMPPSDNSTTTSPSTHTFVDAELPSRYDEDSIVSGSGQEPASSGTKCQLLRGRALAGVEVFYTPECDENGHYKPLQCKDDQCWCADADGRVIPYTRQRVTGKMPDCTDKTSPKRYSNERPPSKTLVVTTVSSSTVITSRVPDDPALGQQTGVGFFFLRTDIMAGIFVGTGVGLICAVILVICIVHRMKKKDEGSYALGEPRRSPICLLPYERAPTKEVYA